MNHAILKKSALLAAVLAASTSATAMTYVMPDDQALLQRADGVLVGTVVSEPVAGPKRGLPQLRHRILVERVIAGQAPAEVVMELPGVPKHGLVQAYIPGIPRLEAGQRVLVFFDQRKDGTLAPAELSLGLFFETADAQGLPTWERQLEGAHALNKAEAERQSRGRDAARFERWIRRTARGVASTSDYFVATPAKYTLAQSGFNDGLSARWFEFDANSSVLLRAVAGGMANATFDEFGAVAAAVGAWTNDAGSRILLNYGGTVASDPGNNSTNGINAVVWDDPGADISGSYNCSSGGVLAIGGSFASSATGSVGGRTYHRMVESFVITQDGAACIYNGHNGLDGAEILAHEVGHTLGFGHSCESGGCPAGSVADDALMRSYVHRDGRGAALRSDDRAAAAAVYPAAAGGGGTGGSGGSTNTLLENGFE